MWKTTRTDVKNISLNYTHPSDFPNSFVDACLYLMKKLIVFILCMLTYTNNESTNTKYVMCMINNTANLFIGDNTSLALYRDIWNIIKSVSKYRCYSYFSGEQWMKYLSLYIPIMKRNQERYGLVSKYLPLQHRVIHQAAWW